MLKENDFGKFTMSHIIHRYFWGEVTPLGGGGPSTDRGSKNGDISTRFRRRRRREIFLSTFSKFLGNLLIKMQ